MVYFRCLRLRPVAIAFSTAFSHSDLPDWDVLVGALPGRSPSGGNLLGGRPLRSMYRSAHASISNRSNAMPGVSELHVLFRVGIGVALFLLLARFACPVECGLARKIVSRKDG